MRRTGLLYDDVYLLHDTGPYHPEMPERLQMIYKGLREGGLLPHLTILHASRADMKWIEAIHDKAYIRRFEEICLAGIREFDCADNQICMETFDIAIQAVGGVLDTVRRVVTGELDNAFCAVRPPGHHAETHQALGFCYFNNVAIAARYLQAEHGIRRVGIVDFDVHHGNGTQQIFQQDPTVFYYSIHQHPSFAFPGTGREFERGTNQGYGFTLNSPILPGQGDSAYQTIIEKDLFPVFDAFEPEVLLLSTGFDAHCDDEMSDIMLSTEGYSWIMEQMMILADRYCGGKVVSILEGGYCLERLPELARNHVSILLRD